MADPTTSKAILKDLDKWSERRLKNWFMDSVDRYETMDIPENDAVAYTTATLTVVLAQILAASSLSGEECAYNLLETIQNIRKIASRSAP